MLRRSLLFAAFTLSLFLCASATAATVLEMNLEALTRASDLVVMGRVTTVEASMQDGRIFTDIHVSVEKQYKGDSVSTVHIRHLGGRTAELATYVPGMPSFEVGERAVLFLEKPRSVEHYVVTGLSQGKWPVVTTEDGTTITRAPFQGIKFVRPVKQVEVTPLEDESLSTFETRLRALLTESNVQ